MGADEHGFSKMEGRKGDKLTKIFKDEKEILDHLKMQYKTPEERNDPTIIDKSDAPVEKVPELKPKPEKKVTSKKVCKKSTDAKDKIEMFKKRVSKFWKILVKMI